MLSLTALLARVAPNLYLPIDLSKAEWFSGDPVVQEETKNDKYMWHGNPRFGHAVEILETVEKVVWKYICITSRCAANKLTLKRQ